MIEESATFKLGYISATLKSAAGDSEREVRSLYANTFRQAERYAEELLQREYDSNRMEEVYRALNSREERARAQDEHLEEAYEDRTWEGDVPWLSRT
jgi:hypothetical protein